MENSFFYGMTWQWHKMMAENSHLVDLCEVPLSFFHHGMILLGPGHAVPYLFLYLSQYCACSLSCHQGTYPKKPFKWRLHKYKIVDLRDDLQYANR
jgi:hypothetical protein